MYYSILDLIGNTPLYKVGNTNIYAKLECFNPTGSIKDRVAKQMILDAMRKGLLKKNSVIIEPTSGNTGIGLAAIGKALGYEVLLTMPDSMSIERRNFFRAYGARLVLTDAKEGMRGAIEKALELAQGNPNAFLPNQFENLQNPLAHYWTTGPELWRQLEGNIDIFVCGIGTGGTISGTGKYLKEKNPNLFIVGVEPEASPILSKGYAGVHQIQGIGAGFVPKLLDRTLLDEIQRVTDEDAIEAARQFNRQEGILVGISSGAVWTVAKKLARLYPNKTIAVIFPDSGNRYFSTHIVE